MKKWMLLYLVLMLCAPAMVLATEDGGNAPPPGTNPTDVLTRGDLDFKYVNSQSGADSYSLIGRFDYALRPDMLLRVDVPLSHVDPNRKGLDAETGIGDLFMRFGWRFHEEKGFAAFFGADFILDTATEEVLGGGTHIFAPLLAGIQLFPEHNALGGVILAHYLDVGGSDRQDFNETEIRPLAVFSLKDGMWITVDTHFYIDWKNDNEFGWFQELQFGKMLSPQFGITATPGVGLIGDNRFVPDWQFKAGVRYFF